VHGLTVLHSECYDALDAIPEPDAIFIGGGLSADLILAAKKKLPAGGRLVAHAVTVQSEALLLAAHQQDGGMLVRIQVNYAQPVGEYHGWRGLMPVTQYIWHKGGDA
jgi:precorrin-6Y C5,15-methyltransferase (decarboxylating)